jgi:hypothetical protein
MPFVLAVLGVAAIIAIVVYAAVLTYTAMIFIGGAGLGGILVALYIYGEWQKQQVYEERRRERDHQRMIEIIQAARSGRFDQVLPLEDHKHDVKQIRGQR